MSEPRTIKDAPLGEQLNALQTAQRILADLDYEQIKEYVHTSFGRGSHQAMMVAHAQCLVRRSEWAREEAR